MFIKFIEHDINGFVKELKAVNFNVMTGVNTLFNGLLNHPDFKNVSFKNCKFSVAGGMALQDAVALRWEDLTGPSRNPKVWKKELQLTRTFVGESLVFDKGYAFSNGF